MQSSSSATKKVKDVKASNAITKSNHKSTALKAPRGNFVNYYAIRRDVQQCGVITDRRVSSITKWINCHRIVEGTQCRKIERYLDVGCNNGQIMFELANLLKDQPSFLMGVDVDEDLIQKASEEAKKRGYVNNLYQNVPLGSGRIGYSASQPRKRIRLDSSDRKFHALTVPCEWTNLESSDKNRQIILDQNVQGYDLITALSITKWIQLSYSDFGLKRFFARVCTSLRPGGTFILEPQPFKSYKNLHKITEPESQERNNLKNMKVFPDDVPWILCVELGLKGPFIIQQRGQDGFLRDLLAFLQPLEITECFVSRRKALLASTNSTDDMEIPWVGRNRDSCV